MKNIYSRTSPYIHLCNNTPLYLGTEFLQPLYEDLINEV